MARGRKGILIQANNGPVIGYDETGLRMRLSDETIQQISDRLPDRASAQSTPIDPRILGDIDAWNVVQQGDWLCFDAKLPSYPETRRFRRHAKRPGIFAEPPGVLLGLFSVGGPSRCDLIDAPLQHPAHIITADDDIGAVGMGGIEDAPALGVPAPVRHATLDTLTADALVGLRRAAGGASPVIYTRCETDSSPTIDAFSNGQALRNLDQAMGNFVQAARALGVAAKALPIAIDYCAEDVLSDADSYLSGMHHLLDVITDIAAKHGLHQPHFLLPFPASPARHAAHASLSVISGTHRVIYTGPQSQFPVDRFGRATPESLSQHAQLNAQILQAHLLGDDWHCPRLLLAEKVDAKVIRVITDAKSPLVLAQPATKAGLELRAKGKKLSISKLAIAAQDPFALEITLKAAVPPGTTLRYGETSAAGVRDSFALDTATGVTLHRWALPAQLEVTGC